MAENTKRVTRHDIGTLDVLNAGDGFLRARVRFARAGVFPYVADGKISYEAKLPEELFSVSTLDSAKRVPVTDGHPTELLSSQNYAQHIRGSLGDTIVVAEGFLEAEETIFDSALIEKIKSGESAEVSIGFTCESDDKVGEYNGTRYDSIQRNIKINHIAHVPKGRAGRDVRAYIDGADVPTTNLNFKKDESEEKTKGAKKMADENQQEQKQENTQEISEQKFFELFKKFFIKLFSGADKSETSEEQKTQNKGMAPTADIPLAVSAAVSRGGEFPTRQVSNYLQLVLNYN